MPTLMQAVRRLRARWLLPGSETVSVRSLAQLAGIRGPIERFYREIFLPGTEGLIEYWRDAPPWVPLISQAPEYSLIWRCPAHRMGGGRDRQ